MAQQNWLTSMQTFIVVWVGQLVSTIGSYMSAFALTLWAWELTGQATTLALVGFFTQIPSVLISPLAGVIVDRWNRKFLIMAGDAIAGLSSLTLLCLHLTGHLQIWHLYATGAVNGAFSQIQELAYTASITSMVPKQQYARASGMISALHYGSAIIAPALAGVLFYVIGLAGILTIDLLTFGVAIATVFFVTIPQPTATDHRDRHTYNSIWQELIFGCRYVFTQSSLVALLLAAALFQFAHDLGSALYSPMILARSSNDARVLGSIASAAGIGGVIGAVLVSTWGGTKRRIHGFLLGMVGAGLSKIVFGLGQISLIWVPAQFCSSLNFPWMSSSSDAIWLSKVKPDVQGRVFATRSLVVLATSAIATLIAGPLADRVFEPAMMSGGWMTNLLGGIFGTGAGAGMAVLYVMSSICLIVVGLVGYSFRKLRDVEAIVPDYDASQYSTLNNKQVT